jgi:hypothetical protein
MSIIINLDKAKDIGRNIRRQQRAAEFAPLDQVIAARIPGTTIKEVEVKRQEIRNKYAQMQSAINAADTPEQIKAALEGVASTEE